MGKTDLKHELQAIGTEEMIEAVKHTSWKMGGREGGFEEEFSALKEEYPAFGAAVELMVEADVASGKTREDAWSNATAAAWGFLTLKHLIDTDELNRIIDR